jgi:hypothetical protein
LPSSLAGKVGAAHVPAGRLGYPGIARFSGRKEEGGMSNITAVAKQFFEACETGKGWEGCRACCTPDASFSAQAEPLADIRTL